MCMPVKRNMLSKFYAELFTFLLLLFISFLYLLQQLIFWFLGLFGRRLMIQTIGINFVLNYSLYIVKM